MARITLEKINIVAKDMDRTLAFYRRLGLDIPTKAVWQTSSGAHHAEVRGPEGELTLAIDSFPLAREYDEGWREPDGQGRSILGFHLPSRADVDAAWDRMTSAGAKGRQAPYDAFWGSRYAIVEDPDGNLVGLMSSPDTDRESALPAI